MRDQWVQMDIPPNEWKYEGILVKAESETENEVCLSASNTNGRVKACGENLKEAMIRIELKIEKELM